MSVSQETLFSIHKAQEKHSAEIKRLIMRSGLNPSSLKWQNFTIALDQKENFIGCAQVKRHADASIELASLIVIKSWRKQGVATALMQRLLVEHPQELYLMCHSRLGSFYENFDFCEIDEHEMPKYFRRISKLLGVIENLRKADEGLLIMRRLGKISL